MIVTSFCTQRLHYTIILYLCRALFLRVHNPGGKLAVYLPVKITGALQLDRDWLLTKFSLFLEASGAPGVPGWRGAHRDPRTGRHRVCLESRRQRWAEPVQPRRYCVHCAAPDRHGEGCSTMDVKERLLIIKKWRHPECWSGVTLARSHNLFCCIRRP